MGLQDMIDFLKSFRSQTQDSKNQKYAGTFIRVLNEVSLKQLNDSNRKRLESELELIHQNFNLKGQEIKIKRELKHFIKFMRTELSITIPWYYTSLGGVIGLLCSVFFGIFSMIIGVVIGCGIGYLIDYKAKKEDKKLNTELNDFLF